MHTTAHQPSTSTAADLDEQGPALLAAWDAKHPDPADHAEDRHLLCEVFAIRAEQHAAA